MMGGSLEDVVNAVSNAWIDGQSLRTYIFIIFCMCVKPKARTLAVTVSNHIAVHWLLYCVCVRSIKHTKLTRLIHSYRHFPNAGSRKSWAAGDATSRAVRLGIHALKGEMGYPTALTAKTWGFYDVLFKSQPFKFQRPYGTYVMENVLFKVSFPAEFHAQTAVECALKLHPQLQAKGGVAHVKQVIMNTHQSAIRIIDKTGVCVLSPISNLIVYVQSPSSLIYIL